MKTKATSSKAKLAEEVAVRLDAHLRRMEADPKINKKSGGVSNIYSAHAWAEVRNYMLLSYTELLTLLDQGVVRGSRARELFFYRHHSG